MAQADVVDLDRGAIMGGAGYGDLELARQERKFRMRARPLPQELRRRARVLDLVRRDAGEMIGGDIADAIAGGLDGVHLDFRQRLENIGRVDELRPVVLEILARREMAVAAVIFVRDVGKAAHLARGERAIGNGDAQHIGVELKIEPVHQAEGAEFVLGQRCRRGAGAPVRGTRPRAP